MSEVQRHEKFMRCAAIAARPLSEAQAGRIIEGTDKLDQCDDIAALAALVGCEQGQHIERVSTSVDLF
jgi:hypothetical protein